MGVAVAGDGTGQNYLEDRTAQRGEGAARRDQREPRVEPRDARGVAHDVEVGHAALGRGQVAHARGQVANRGTGPDHPHGQLEVELHVVAARARGERGRERIHAKPALGVGNGAAARLDADPEDAELARERACAGLAPVEHGTAQDQRLGVGACLGEEARHVPEVVLAVGVDLEHVGRAETLRRREARLDGRALAAVARAPLHTARPELSILSTAARPAAPLPSSTTTTSETWAAPPRPPPARSRGCRRSGSPRRRETGGSRAAPVRSFARRCRLASQSSVPSRATRARWVHRAREHRDDLAPQPRDAGTAVRRAQEHLAERGVVPGVDEPGEDAELSAALAHIAREVARHGQSARRERARGREARALGPRHREVHPGREHGIEECARIADRDPPSPASSRRRYWKSAVASTGRVWGAPRSRRATAGTCSSTSLQIAS